MSRLKALINREVDRKQQRIRGRVLTDPQLKDFDLIGMAFPTWVVDVDVGRDQILRDVPVKINGPKARFYAHAGFPVWLDKDAQGRYQVTAPADRAKNQGNVILVDEDTGIASAVGNVGFTSTREVFDFYKGGGVGSSFWNDDVNGFPKITVLDEDGNEVIL